MNEIEALILGAIQGATEFLPVSSSGHLVIGQELLGLSLPGITFEVVLHLATLISVFVVYRERLWGLLRGVVVERNAESFRYVGLLAAATLPVAVVGLAFGDPIEALFGQPAVIGVALLVTGALLFSTRWALRRESNPTFGLRTALLIGTVQCIALVPGISRSGSTVVAALWLGVSPVEAAAFSFLLSIPAIAGAALLQSRELGGGIEGVGVAPIVVGFLTAMIVGILAIGLFVRMLRSRSFPAFAWYCWGAGLLFLVWLGFRG